MSCPDCDDPFMVFNGHLFHVLLYGCVVCNISFYCKSQLFTHQYMIHGELFAPHHMLIIPTNYCDDFVIHQLKKYYDKMDIYRLPLSPLIRWN